MNHTVKIPLPLIIANSWVNVRSIYPIKSWFILTIISCLTISIFFFIKASFKHTDIELYLIFSAIIVSMVIFNIFIICLFYLIFLRKCIIIEGNSIIITSIHKATNIEKVLTKDSIRKIVLEKNVRKLGNQNLKTYDAVGTFFKVVIIDENNFKHEVTPEIYTVDGNYPKTWNNFLAKLSKHIGLPIEDETQTS